MKKMLVGLLLFTSIAFAKSQSIEIQNDTDQYWVAGTVGGVRFTSTNLAPTTLYIGLIHADELDGGFNISTTSITADGPDADAFTIPFGMPSGSYNLLLVAVLSDEPQSLITVRGTGIITVASAITAPAAGETLKSGKTYTMVWPGREPDADVYGVYLVGGSLGDTGFVFLGAVDAQQGWFEWTVPRDIEPGKGFQLQLSGRHARGANSEYFNIVHDQRKTTRF